MPCPHLRRFCMTEGSVCWMLFARSIVISFFVCQRWAFQSGTLRLRSSRWNCCVCFSLCDRRPLWRRFDLRWSRLCDIVWYVRGSYRAMCQYDNDVLVFAFEQLAFLWCYRCIMVYVSDKAHVMCSSIKFHTLSFETQVLNAFWRLLRV